MVLGIPKRTLIILGVLVGVVVIYALGSDQQSSSAEGADAGECTVTVTADVLNVRSGPSTQADIVDQFAEDTEAEATDQVRNGFREVEQDRWAADEYLEPTDESACG